MNGKNKRRQSIDSDSTSSVIPIKKKKISTAKSLIQEKRVQIPECKPSILIFKVYRIILYLVIIIFTLKYSLKYKYINSVLSKFTAYNYWTIVIINVTRFAICCTWQRRFVLLCTGPHAPLIILKNTKYFKII